MAKRTMAEALTLACREFTQKGGNPGRIGHRVLTNNAKMGIRPPPAQRKQQTAVSAVMKG